MCCTIGWVICSACLSRHNHSRNVGSNKASIEANLHEMESIGKSVSMAWQGMLGLHIAVELSLTLILLIPPQLNVDK